MIKIKTNTLNKYPYNKILFSCYFANGWHGSIIHILEIAEYFTKNGYDVSIAAFLITDEIKNYARERGIDLFLISDTDIEPVYDIYWGVHFLSMSYLISKGLKYNKIIYNCLSSSHSLELPPISEPELPIYANSLETANMLKNNTTHKNIHILQNLVPDIFLKEPVLKELDKVAVISNHVSSELRLLGAKLDIDYYGVGDIYKKITPEILDKYSLVITIGKTVPYCLLRGIPVYVYDQNGPGYINKENLDMNAEYNFSGRPWDYINSDELYEDIVLNYDKNQDMLYFLYEYAIENHLLSKQINQLLRNLDTYNFHYDLKKIYKPNFDKEVISAELILDLIGNKKGK